MGTEVLNSEVFFKGVKRASAALSILDTSIDVKYTFETYAVKTGQVPNLNNMLQGDQYYILIRPQPIIAGRQIFLQLDGSYFNFDVQGGSVPWDAANNAYRVNIRSTKVPSHTWSTANLNFYSDPGYTKYIAAVNATYNGVVYNTSQIMSYRYWLGETTDPNIYKGTSAIYVADIQPANISNNVTTPIAFYLDDILIESAPRTATLINGKVSIIFSVPDNGLANRQTVSAVMGTLTPFNVVYPKIVVANGTYTHMGGPPQVDINPGITRTFEIFPATASWSTNDWDGGSSGVTGFYLDNVAIPNKPSTPPSNPTIPPATTNNNRRTGGGADNIIKLNGLTMHMLHYETGNDRGNHQNYDSVNGLYRWGGLALTNNPPVNGVYSVGGIEIKILKWEDRRVNGRWRRFMLVSARNTTTAPIYMNMLYGQYSATIIPGGGLKHGEFGGGNYSEYGEDKYVVNMDGYITIT